MSFRAIAGLLMLFLVSACAGGGSESTRLPAVSLAALTATAGVRPALDDGTLPPPFTPGVDAEPLVAHAPLARLSTLSQRSAESTFATELGDPNRAVFRHGGSPVSRLGTRNVVAGGNGEAVGLFTSPTFSAAGSVAALGVQLNYTIATGGNFFHTHQLVNNQCFEYGINYIAQAPTLFGYNWCTGGNTPPGWMNIGLVGDPGGILNTWSAGGNSGLLHWDAYNSLNRLILEEIERSDGWHLLGYNWTLKKYVDLMNGHGVTGTKNACCGWSVFEIHVAPGTPCHFDPGFPAGHELLYDVGLKALVGSVWRPLNAIPAGGFNYATQIDCANISGQSDPSYTTPYLSGGFVDPTATAHAGDWWLIQR